MLKERDKAPDFNLLGNDGKMHSLSEFKEKYLVLYFYPKDGTPGCTREACAFRDANAAISKKGAKIAGISKDAIDLHEKFATKNKLNFLLLSDPESKVIKAYGAYGKRGAFGFGTLRETFIIGKDGKVLRILKGIKPEEHAKLVLEFLNGRDNGRA
ncbi:MAG: peroxiredoxin [Candidatus Micrarchaeia archaeon]